MEKSTKFYAFAGSPDTKAVYFEIVDTTEEPDIDYHLGTMSDNVGAWVPSVHAITLAVPTNECTLTEAFAKFGAMMERELQERC